MNCTLLARRLCFACLLLAAGISVAYPQSIPEPLGLDTINRTRIQFVGDVAFYQNQPFSGYSKMLNRDLRLVVLVQYQQGVQEGVHKKFDRAGKNVIELNEYANGILHGKHFKWYVAGPIREAGFYDGGKKDSTWQKWDRDSTLLSEIEYVSGEMQGTRRRWFANGQPRDVEFYQNGQRVGEALYYYENGQKKRHTTYVRGRQLGWQTQWFENGQKKDYGFYRGHKLDTLYKAWHENGQLAELAPMRRGKRVDTTRTWYANAQLKSEGPYVDGRRDGQFRFFGEDGRLLGRGTFADGNIQNGINTRIDGDRLRMVGQYQDGLVHGITRWWDRNGAPQSVTYYQQGKRHGPDSTFTKGLGWKVSYYLHGKLHSDVAEAVPPLMPDSLPGTSIDHRGGKYSYKGYWYTGIVRIFHSNDSLHERLTVRHGVLHGSTQRYFNNGQLREIGAHLGGKRSGTWEYYNRNGVHTSTVDFEDGKGHGLETWLHPNGQPKKQLPKQRGKIHGTVSTWDSLGTLLDQQLWKNGEQQACMLPQMIGDPNMVHLSELRLENGKYLDAKGLPVTAYVIDTWCNPIRIKGDFQVENGLVEGRVSSWHTNGMIETSGQMKNGKREGRWVKKQANGQLQHVDYWLNGKRHGPDSTFSRDGQPFQVRNFRLGRREGLNLTYYHQQNAVRTQANFRDNVYHGPFRNLYTNGNVETEGNYDSGKKTGTWTTYGTNGAVLVRSVFEEQSEGQSIERRINYWPKGGKKMEGVLINGKMDGLWQHWHPDGNPSMEGGYLNGRKNGNWKVFDTKGKPITEIHYQNGKRQ